MTDEHTDRQPWNAEREKLGAEAQVIGAALRDVIDFLTGPAGADMHPESHRNLLGVLAFAVMRFTASPSAACLPGKDRTWIVTRLCNATACLPWKE